MFGLTIENYFLVAIIGFSACGATQLTDDDVSAILRIVEESNPNLVKIVHDETAETTNILSRIVRRINNNENRYNAIPIHIDTFEAKGAVNPTVNLLQNYTTFTVIIAADNSEGKIEAIVSDIDKKLHRKHLNKYLVVFQSNQTNDPDWTRKVLQLFWKQYVLDVVLFHREGNSIALKSFNPFQSRVIEFNVNASVNELYATKLLDLNGQEFNILLLDVVFILVPKTNGAGYEGVDGNMIEFFGQKWVNSIPCKIDLITIHKFRLHFRRLNTSIAFVRYSTSNILTEMTAKLENGDVQMVMPVIAYNIRESKYRVEISNSFQTLDFCVVAPRPTENDLSSWLNSGIFVAHSRYMLLGTLITFAIVYKVFWSIHDVFQKKTDEVYESKESSFVSVVFMMYRVFFGDSLTYMPRSTSLRILLIGWMFFCFLITSTITANLLSTLIEPAEIEELNSVDDLAEANLKLVIPSELATKFKDNSLALWNRLNASIETIPWKEFLNVTEHRKTHVAYSAANYVIEYILHKNVDKVTKKPIYYKLKEYIFNMIGVYHLEPGSAYLQRFNELLGLIHQVGLYQHWFQRAVFNMTVSSGFDKEEEEDNDDQKVELPVVLKLQNIRGIFLLWLMGIALAFIVFLVERGSKCKSIEHLRSNLDCCRSSS